MNKRCTRPYITEFTYIRQTMILHCNPMIVMLRGTGTSWSWGGACSTYQDSTYLTPRSFTHVWLKVPWAGLCVALERPQRCCFLPQVLLFGSRHSRFNIDRALNRGELSVSVKSIHWKSTCSIFPCEHKMQTTEVLSDCESKAFSMIVEGEPSRCRGLRNQQWYLQTVDDIDRL